MFVTKPCGKSIRVDTQHTARWCGPLRQYELLVDLPWCRMTAPCRWRCLSFFFFFTCTLCYIFSSSHFPPLDTKPALPARGDSLNESAGPMCCCVATAECYKKAVPGRLRLHYRRYQLHDNVARSFLFFLFLSASRFVQNIFCLCAKVEWFHLIGRTTASQWNGETQLLRNYLLRWVVY